MWLHAVRLPQMAHLLLEAGDNIEYLIHLGGFLVKKIGVNLIYENDKKDYRSYLEAMTKNVSTDQAVSGDKKVWVEVIWLLFLPS